MLPASVQRRGGGASAYRRRRRRRRSEGETEGEGERECKQCHSVQEAMLQSTLPRHEGTSQATMRLRVSAEKFSSSPPRERCSPRLIRRYTFYFLSSLIHLACCLLMSVSPFALDGILPKSALQELMSVCMPAVWRLPAASVSSVSASSAPAITRQQPASQSVSSQALLLHHPCLKHGTGWK